MRTWQANFSGVGRTALIRDKIANLYGLAKRLVISTALLQVALPA